MSNHLTDTDLATIEGFLTDFGYADVGEWALDNDFYQNEVSTEWHTYADLGPFADPVDIEAACFRFIEDEGQRQQEQRYGFF